MKKVGFKIEDMKNLYESSRNTKQKGRNDRLEKNRGGVSYYLFDNEIAFYNPENKTIALSDCGWMTITTKDRLNGLGANITQKKFVWYTGDKLWDGTKIIPI
jgi:hypothetical protein